MTSKFINEPGYKTKLMIAIFKHMKKQGSSKTPDAEAVLKTADKLFLEDEETKDVIDSIFFGQEGYLDLFQAVVADFKSRKIRVSANALKKAVDTKYAEKLIKKAKTPYVTEEDYLEVARAVIAAATAARKPLNPKLFEKYVHNVFAKAKTDGSTDYETIAVEIVDQALSALKDPPGKHQNKYGWENFVSNARYLLHSKGEAYPKLADVWSQADELYETVRDGKPLPEVLELNKYGQSNNMTDPGYKKILVKAMKRLNVRSATREALALADAMYAQTLALPQTSTTATASYLLRGGRR